MCCRRRHGSYFEFHRYFDSVSTSAWYFVPGLMPGLFEAPSTVPTEGKVARLNVRREYGIFLSIGSGPLGSSSPQFFVVLKQTANKLQLSN